MTSDSKPMQSAPSSERVHIAIFGRCNAGKSTLVNRLTGQDVAIVSPVAGTTTDPVQKAIEINGLGAAILIDTPGLDDTKEGTYKVHYYAVDSDGNRLTVVRTVVVESKTGQKVREKAQVVLNEIIKPGMTQDEKIYAVFRRVRNYMGYASHSDKSSVENAAYEGFSKWYGDCYTYYAMVRVMLDMLEIPNLEVARVDGKSNHWWNLVQFEDGKYYHIDAIPHQVTDMEHFKMTESVIVAYTNNPAVARRRPNYYVYDHTLPEYQNIEIAQ